MPKSQFVVARALSQSYVRVIVRRGFTGVGGWVDFAHHKARKIQTLSTNANARFWPVMRAVQRPYRLLHLDVCQ